MEVLGLTSVALGFAFRDILQNFLAGILILWTHPFVIDDQIVYKDFEGTVTDIQTRATFVETYDGRRIVIPNADPSVGWSTTSGLALLTTSSMRGRSCSRPCMGSRAWNQRLRPTFASSILADFSIKLRVRWWIKPPRRADVVSARDLVLTRVKARLIEEGIDLPYPTTQVLFHDQTEVTDGDRRHQREGWPAGKKHVPSSRGREANPPPSREPR